MSHVGTSSPTKADFRGYTIEENTLVEEISRKFLESMRYFLELSEYFPSRGILLLFSRKYALFRRVLCAVLVVNKVVQTVLAIREYHIKIQTKLCAL
jgi:hypothetical protein